MIAQPGETIVLRGGVYRELLAPKNDGVTVRAMKGQRVAMSTADLIEGWRREPEGGWSAPLAAKPQEMLRDGQPWTELRYDAAARRITVRTGGDPRLRVMESVVWEQVSDLGGKRDVEVEGITGL